jgi:hypothetical protein
VLGVIVVWFAVRWDAGERRAEPAAEVPLAAPPEPAGPAPEPAEPATPEPAAPPASAPAAPSPQPAPTPAPNEAPSAHAAPSMVAPTRSGPVDELKQQFASTTRDAAAASFEKRIETAFHRPEVPDGLLRSVKCRATVCRVETQWSSDRAQGLMVALMDLITRPATEPDAFDRGIAISPEGEPSADGSRAIDFYLKRAAAPAQPPR